MSEAGGALTASDGASEVAPSLTSLSTLPPQEFMDPPHIITGRENSDGYFKDKVYLLQEQQRENNDGKACLSLDNSTYSRTDSKACTVL